MSVPKGYVLMEIKVHNPAAMADYRARAEAAVSLHGGRFLIRGGNAEILEGPWTAPERLVVIEFDSVEQAHRFYNSAEYQSAKQYRVNAAETNILVVSGVDNQV